MHTLLHDLRLAFRHWLKRPAFTVLAMLTLALGIGANTTIFSLINSVLIKPLPFPNAHQLLYLQETTPDGTPNGRVSGGAFKDWREHLSKLEHVAVYSDIRRNLTGLGAPERITGLQVSTEFLRVLGVRPMLGRDFAAREDSLGENSRILLLSHALWQSRYGGDRNVLGRSVSLDQISHTIIGVLPPRALLEDEAQFLVPEVIDAPGVNWGYGGHWREVIGRLRTGVSLAEANTELKTVRQQLAANQPAFKKDWGVRAVTLQSIYSGETRSTLLLLLGAVALVLLIACVNVSNMLLAHGQAQSQEMAIRSALGASSSWIIRQVLTESLLLALGGCALGLLFAAGGIPLLARWVEGQLPHAFRPVMDLNVLVFSVVVACGCGALFSLLPAWRASQVDPNQALKETERGSLSGSRKRSQSLLVASECAFTLVLLIATGLFLRSFIRLHETDLGFDPKQALAFDLSFPDLKYPNAESRLRFVKALNQRISGLPGVASVGAVSALPLSHRGDTEMVSRADGPPRTDYLANCSYVTGDYFKAMGMKLVAGRALTEADNTTQAPRVMVIDTGLARDLYPGQDPLGHHLRFNDQSWEIVGVVGPVRFFAVDRVWPNLYLPQVHGMVSTSILVRTTVPPLSLLNSVRTALREADPDQPMAHVRTMEQAVQEALAKRGSTLSLLVAFAGVAISLASIGIYGVVSYSVGQRAREISIRSALGAQRRDIIHLLLKGGLVPSLFGIGIGLGAALALTRLLEHQLVEVQVQDPTVFITSVLVLGGVAVASTLLPALRAAKQGPLAALRSR